MLLMAPGCAVRTPVAPLDHVSEPHAIRVRFRPEPYALRVDLRGEAFPVADTKRLFAEAHESIASFNRTLAHTLRRAGYEVTANGPCDVQVVRVLYFEIEPRQPRHGYFSVSDSDFVRAVFYVYDTKGNEIDRFEFRLPETPESVAVDLVNAMVQSPKVGRYAETRKKSGPVDKPVADEAAVPAAGATD
jgi:hypothetical protein